MVFKWIRDLRWRGWNCLSESFASDVWHGGDSVVHVCGATKVSKAVLPRATVFPQDGDPLATNYWPSGL